MQFGDNARTRSWQDFTKVNDAMKFICTKYEEFLKKKNPQQAYLTYNIIDLYAYIDSVGLIHPFLIKLNSIFLAERFERFNE